MTKSQYRPRVHSRSHSPTQRSKMAGSDNFRNDPTVLLRVRLGPISELEHRLPYE